MNIAIILLGGTISFSENGYDNSFIYDLINQSRILENYSIYNLFEEDSVDLYHDMHKIRDIIGKIQGLEENRVLILLGTDRMIQIGKVIKKNVKNKKIILTGSIIPYRKKVETDSIFNFGFAIGSLKSIDYPCVLIAMNGILFDPYTTIKNYKTLTFQSIKDNSNK